mmetsp:Transcript_9071/g.11335  ORF Transcript_9071/g.11335 Transcript_9071/m.11335 type:complete len:168 (+) Transcript_9071:38-541(+)
MGNCFKSERDRSRIISHKTQKNESCTISSKQHSFKSFKFIGNSLTIQTDTDTNSFNIPNKSLVNVSYKITTNDSNSKSNDDINNNKTPISILVTNVSKLVSALKNNDTNNNENNSNTVNNDYDDDISPNMIQEKVSRSTSIQENMNVDQLVFVNQYSSSSSIKSYFD